MKPFSGRVFLLALVCATSRQTAGVNICTSGEITSSEGQITSPNFPNKYPKSMDCSLTITADPGAIIVIKFDQFDLEDDEDDHALCSYDSLLVIEDGKERRRLCGLAQIIEDYTSTGNSVTLHFMSSSTDQEKGFQLTYSTALPAQGDDICPSLKIMAKDKWSGSVHSPNFPDLYPSNKKCVALIDVPDNYFTNVWFTKFALQRFHVGSKPAAVTLVSLGLTGVRSFLSTDSPTCQFDKLEVRDWITGATMCGKDGDKVPPAMLLKGRRIHIEFTSDSTIQDSGFLLHYNVTRIQQGRCMCTPGLSYAIVKNYKTKINRKTDDIQFEFRTKQSSGMIMYTKGYHRDYVYVGLRNGNVLFYHVDLGTGAGKVEATGLKFNDNQWHKVHIQRTDRQLRLSFDGNVVAQGRTRGGFNRLDVPLSTAYFLGAPSDVKLVPNFIGCVRNLNVDGREPIANAVAGKADYHVSVQRSFREC